MYMSWIDKFESWIKKNYKENYEYEYVEIT